MKNLLSRKFGYYVINIEFGNLLEIFLVFAVASLLAIRMFLELTGYPKLGGGSFHIAHMLWGGLLMMLAIFLLLAFLNKQARHLAAVVGGIGFGTFIDELGKFITSDNNYFYQPSVAIIYIIFVLLFFSLREVEKRTVISKEAYAANAIEEVKELLINDLDETEREKAIRLLEKADSSNVLVASLKKILDGMQARPIKPPGLLLKVKRILTNLYTKFFRTERFSKTLVIFFSFFALIGLATALWDFRTEPSFADWGELISALVTSFLIVGGIRQLGAKQMLKAYHSFKNSILVSIFFTQFFLFIKDQFSALIGLAISILAYIACQYLINEEDIRLKTKQGQSQNEIEQSK